VLCGWAGLALTGGGDAGTKGWVVAGGAGSNLRVGSRVGSGGGLAAAHRLHAGSEKARQEGGGQRICKQNRWDAQSDLCFLQWWALGLGQCRRWQMQELATLHRLTTTTIAAIMAAAARPPTTPPMMGPMLEPPPLLPPSVAAASLLASVSVAAASLSAGMAVSVAGAAASTAGWGSTGAPRPALTEPGTTVIPAGASRVNTVSVFRAATVASAFLVSMPAMTCTVSPASRRRPAGEAAETTLTTLHVAAGGRGERRKADATRLLSQKHSGRWTAAAEP
jgi:hypothetical protein